MELAYVSNKPLENSQMNADQFKVLKSQISRSDKEDDRRATSLVKQVRKHVPSEARPERWRDRGSGATENLHVNIYYSLRVTPILTR